MNCVSMWERSFLFRTFEFFAIFVAYSKSANYGFEVWIE